MRWEKRADGTSRVRVSPELVEIVAGGAPTTKWQQTFDAPLTDVFQVQGDIAGKVASALDVALGAGQQLVLAERPTENLQAYDAYLRGEAAWGGNSAAGIEANLAAIRSYSQAVALDSTFALAWAQLARVNSVAYYNVTPTPQFAEAARVASQRAVALAPTRPESHLALGEYFSLIHGDHVRALAAYRRGLEIAPTDADLLNSAAFSEWSLAKFEDAKKHLAESQALDPRSVNTLRRLSMFDLRLHQYADGQGVVDRGLALSPTSLPLIQNGAMLRLAQGDLRGARQIIGEGLKRAEPASLAAYVANYFDLYWVLEDPEQQLTLRGTPAQYGDDRSSWALVQMQLHRLRGDARLRGHGAHRPRGAAQGRTGQPRPARGAGPGPGASGPLQGSDRSGRARACPYAAVEGRVERPLLPTPAGARVHHGEPAREGARPARAAAPDAILALSGLAEDRSRLRPAARQPPFREAGRRHVAGDRAPSRSRPVTWSPGPRARADRVAGAKSSSHPSRPRYTA